MRDTRLSADVRSKRLKSGIRNDSVWIMSTLARAEVLGLSVPERIQLVEDIWDSIAEVPETVSLSDEQKAELDRRLEAYHQNPDEGSPWGIVRERIRSQR